MEYITAGIFIVAAMWLLVALGIVSALGIVFYKLSRKAADTIADAQEQIKDAKEQMNNAQAILRTLSNKYALMSPRELEAWLTTLFSQQIALASHTAVAEKNPDAVTILYYKSLERMIAYMGDDAIAALDMCYGDNYLVRWCELHFAMLDDAGIMGEIIEKEINSRAIAREMATPVQ